MPRSFRLHILLLIAICRTFALKLSLSAASPSTEDIVLTTSWMHEDGDPPSGRFELLVDDLEGLPPRVLSSFSIPNENTGSFVSVLVVSRGAVTAKAVDSKHNVFAMSNTISLNRITSRSSSTLPLTSTTSNPNPSPSPTKMEAQGRNTSNPTSRSGTGATGTDHALTPVLGVTIPIIFLVFLFNFIFCWRMRSRKKRPTSVKDLKNFAKPSKLQGTAGVVSTSSSANLLTRNVNDGDYDKAEAGIRTGLGSKMRMFMPGGLAKGMEAGETSNGGIRMPTGVPKAKVKNGHAPPIHRPSPINIPDPSSFTFHHHHPHHNEPSMLPTGASHRNNDVSGVLPILPYAQEPLLPPPPLTPHKLKRMTPDVPLDLDDQGNSLRISSWKISLDSRV